MRTKKGFTLVELLMTIAIIGILGAMVLPRLFGPTEQSRSTEARNMLGAIRELEEAFQHGPAGVFHGQTDLDILGCDPNNVNWQALGLEDPNINPERYFTYCVNVDTDSSVYIISALREDVPAGVPDAGTFMCLNQDSLWTGNYIHLPLNPGGGSCTPVDNSGCC